MKGEIFSGLEANGGDPLSQFEKPVVDAHRIEVPVQEEISRDGGLGADHEAIIKKRTEGRTIDARLEGEGPVSGAHGDDAA